MTEMHPTSPPPPANNASPRAVPSATLRHMTTPPSPATPTVAPDNFAKPARTLSPDGCNVQATEPACIKVHFKFYHRLAKPQTP